MKRRRRCSLSKSAFSESSARRDIGENDCYLAFFRMANACGVDFEPAVELGGFALVMGGFAG